MTDPWDAQYRERRGLRWWPVEDLVRFVGARYGVGQDDYARTPIGQRASTVILDLGCGTGANAWFLLTQGFSVAGVDAAPAAIETAQMWTRAMSRHEAFRGFVHRLPAPLPFEDNWFDGVVDCQTLQHLRWSEHLPVYREIARVLKPGAWLWSMHLGNDSSDWQLGLGPLVDLWTLGNIEGSQAVYPGNGITCFPPMEALAEVMEAGGLTPGPAETTLRTYRQGEGVAQWWVVTAEKARRPRRTHMA